MRLTKENIDRLRTDAARGEWHQDDELRGYFVVVYPSGTKVFFVRYRTVRGLRRVLRIGEYGRLTPAQARDAAKAHLAAADLGGDPAGQREDARRRPTWGEWVTRYLERIAFQKKSPREDRRFLGATGAEPYAGLLRRWRDRPLDELTREDVEIFRTGVAKDGHPTAANRWLASVRACLSAARKSGLVPFNPALGMKHFAENPPRARTLDDDEMKRFLAAIAKETDVLGAAALRIMVETGCRGAEILAAKWNDFDLVNDPPTWRIPSPKTGRPQVIPVASSTVVLLGRLPRLKPGPDGDLVIPGRGGRRRRNLRKVWERALYRSGLEGKGVRAHDLRRTYGLAVARDAGLHVASKLLRHSNVLVTEAVYAPLGLKELGAATERRSAVLPFPARKGA